MSFTDEQLENAGNAWSDRIIDVQETDDIICITYAIPYAEGRPPISASPGSPDNPLPGINIEPVPGIGVNIGLAPTTVGNSPWEQRGRLRPTIDVEFDPIGGIIENELENRFGGGKMTVCHRKRNFSPTEPIIPTQPPIDLPTAPIPSIPDRNEEIPLDCSSRGWQRAIVHWSSHYWMWSKATFQNNSEWISNVTNGNKSGQHEIYFLDPTHIKSEARRQITATTNYTFVSRGVIARGVRFYDIGQWWEREFPQPVYLSGVWSYWSGGLGLQINNGNPYFNNGYLIYTLMEGRYATDILFENCSAGLPETTPSGTTPRNDMANCCEEIKKRLDEIERKIDRMLKFSGAASGGFEVPDSLLDPSPGDDWVSNIWDAITPDKKRHIKSMPEFWMWWIEKQKEFWGSWPACLKDDKDNQMVIPNLAEAVKVVVGKELILQREVAACQLVAVKTLLETCNDRHQNLYNASLVECLLDFFEIDPEETTEWIKFEMSEFNSENLTMEDIDTPKEIAKLCEGEAQKVKLAKVDFKKQKDSNGKPMETFSATALRSVKIWEAIRFLFGVQLDPNNLENDLAKFLTETRNFSKGKNGYGDNVSGTDDTNDFSQWCEKVEQQFGNELNAPEGAATQPWGNDLSDRPRIIVRGIPPVEADDM